MDVTNLDITTGAGVAAVSIFIVGILKKLYFVKIYKPFQWYPSAINLGTFLVSFGLSGLSMVLFNIQFSMMIANGLVGFLLAIGGYEPLVNIFRGFIKKK